MTSNLYYNSLILLITRIYNIGYIEYDTIKSIEKCNQSKIQFIKSKCIFQIS